MKKKIILSLTSCIAILIACLVTLPASAWGPENRPTYTNKSPADYATFNSITDNASNGDERNFVAVKEVGTEDKYVDELEVTPGKEYEVYIYYHNNAATDTNATGFGVATAVKAASAYPTVVKKNEKGMVSGIISWSYVTPEDPNNAQIGKVWDEAYFTTQSDEVVLRYKTGSATIHNSGATNGSVLSTNLFTKEGTYIGFNELNGVLLGCAEYSGYITYTLVAEKIDSDLQKQVSLDGENWSDSVDAKPGEFVTYKVMFTNTGNVNIANAIFKDSHDAGLTLRPGSVTIYDVNHVDGLVIDDILDISGYNMGDLVPGELVQIVYQAYIDDDTSLCGKTLNNTISLSYNSADQGAAIASVHVNCNPDCTTNPEAPECNCSTNPNLPGCEENCETNPDSPECACLTNPSLPGCEKNCKTNPEMEGCQQLPNTGPLEIVMAVIIIAGIAGGGYYFYRTKKTLQTVESSAKGEGESKPASEYTKEQTGEQTDEQVDKHTDEGDNA